MGSLMACRPVGTMAEHIGSQPLGQHRRLVDMMVCTSRMMLACRNHTTLACNFHMNLACKCRMMACKRACMSCIHSLVVEYIWERENTWLSHRSHSSMLDRLSHRRMWVGMMMWGKHCLNSSVWVNSQSHSFCWVYKLSKRWMGVYNYCMRSLVDCRHMKFLAHSHILEPHIWECHI